LSPRLGVSGPRVGLPLTVLLLATLAAPAGSSFAAMAHAAAPIGFGKSLVQLTSSANPTSLQFGPDGRLYVAQFDGTIVAYDIARNAANDYTVTASETISAIRDLPNHGDDGTLEPAVTGRLVTGILAVGTAADPVLYVTSSDPRSGGHDTGDVGIDTNSGMVSRLRWNGTGWARRNLVRGLPRSEEVHATNGLQLDRSTDTLYVAQGGNTNMGAPSTTFGELPEYALSGAVLAIHLDELPASGVYDLPTLDDPTRAGDPDANDPFGGNDGLNQAKLVPGGPIEVYSPGYRNPYDLLLASNGKLYVTDNGSNAGQGGRPPGEGPEGICTNGSSEPGEYGDDSLHLMTGPGYYGGHPNPTRGNTANTFGGNSPVPSANPLECDYQVPGAESPALATFPSSTNGITEYTASDFGGAMTGNLLAAEWDNYITRIVLNGAGTAVASKQTLFSNAGVHPLDLVAQPDAGPFPGTIWVADEAASTITVYEPIDYGGAVFECSGANDPSLDEDGDGYTNRDEIANGTDPCSAGDTPPDADGDGVSDLNDPDDDNDTRPDTSDPFALDPRNGNQTTIPVRYTFDPAGPSAGALLNSGFTGLMTDGASDYASLFDASKMAVGGAAGVFTIEHVPGGTAAGSRNTQHYAFQVGVNAKPTFTGPFTVHTRILNPFSGLTPQDGQQMGLMLGAGGQDDYVKLVVQGAGGGGVRFAREIGGTVDSRATTGVTLPGPDAIDLYLSVDPVADTIRPGYTVTTGSSTTTRAFVGPAVSVPSSWFVGPKTRTAVGFISTSAGPAPSFPATWDLIEVTEDGSSASVAPADAPKVAAAPASAPKVPIAPGGGEWESRAPSGPLRQEVSYVKTGGSFYLGWGRNSSAHEAYDPSTDSWTTLTPLPTQLDHIQGVAVGGKIYYIGGLVKYPSPEVGTVWIYDPATDTFSQGTPMPAGRERGAGGVAVHDGKIYYAGGLHDGAAVPWFDEYDPATGSWTELPDMPVPREHAQAAVVGDRLFEIGGKNGVVSSGSTPIGDNDAYDFTSGSWITGLKPLTTLRWGFATAVLGSMVLIIGGENPVTAFSRVDAYDTATDTWRKLTPMPTARHGIQAVVYRGDVYVAAGGMAPTRGAPTNVQEVFVPRSTVRPDGQIRLASDSRLLGNDIYNLSGDSQTAAASLSPGGHTNFVVKVENDGTTTDTLPVLGTSSTADFLIRYFSGRSGATEITKDVVAGTYGFQDVPPGAGRYLRMQVTARAGAPSGAAATALVTVSSATRPTSKDVVGSALSVP
jgi:N-acetylneuraminic acid mutarotase